VCQVALPSVFGLSREESVVRTPQAFPSKESASATFRCVCFGFLSDDCSTQRLASVAAPDVRNHPLQQIAAKAAAAFLACMRLREKGVFDDSLNPHPEGV
jgi:hypothetical protein